MRFQTKLFLVFAGFSVLVSVLMLIFTLQSKEIILKNSAENRRNFARVIQISAQRLSAIPENQPEKVYHLIRELQANEAVQEVTIVDRNQKVVASTNSSLLGQIHPLTSMEAIIKEKDAQLDTTSRFTLAEISVPLIRDKRTVGLVRSTVILKDVRHPLEMLYYKNLLITSFILLAGFGSSILILRRLNRPLAQLTLAAERVASGDLGARTSGMNAKDEIGRLSNTFNEMTCKLKEQKSLESKVHSLERKAIVSEIASYLAHEIRNPLNLIVLTAHHLRKQAADVSIDSRHLFTEAIDSLRDEVEHLNRMVSDFLDFGRTSRLMKSEFCLCDLLNSVQVLALHRITSKQINLVIEGDSEVRLLADQEQLRLVFLNLILNSAEAVQSGGRISIRVQKGDRQIRIWVEDNGPGIPAENLEKIFEPYFTQKTHGVGLGLSLVHRIITEHDGRIHAENIDSGGARFEILLPTGA